MVCRAARKVHDQVKNSTRPDLPIIWSEYNASYKNEVAVTDSAFMGPWLADTIRQCDGMVEMMSYWTFSDVFDEQGPIQQPFYGGFGIISDFLKCKFFQLGFIVMSDFPATAYDCRQVLKLGQPDSSRNIIHMKFKTGLRQVIIESPALLASVNAEPSKSSCPLP